MILERENKEEVEKISENEQAVKLCKLLQEKTEIII
jgi:hypothetical protein